MNQEKWAERLEKHMSDYRKEPKRDLWEGIEASLDKQTKRQARFVSLRRWMVAAVIMGAIFGGALWYWQQSERALQSGEESRSLAQTNLIVSENDNQEIHPQALQSQESQIQESKVVTVQRVSERQEESNGQILDTEQKGVSGLPDSYPTESPKETEPKEETSIVHQDRPLPPAVRHQPSQPVIVREKPSRPHRQLMMSLYASGGSGSWEGRNGVLMSPSMLQQFSATRDESKVWLAGYEERQSHSQPVSFGLTLSYPLTDRFSVSTGMVYTKLSSDFLSIMQYDQVHRHQTLYYIGVPLNLQFTLWQWHGLSAYLSAGGQVDWNIKAEANTDGVDQVMNKDRVQFSLGGSLGVQYKLIPQIGVYVEPGIRHYFDNGSRVSNFFKDKPTNFNLQLGLRLHL